MKQRRRNGHAAYLGGMMKRLLSTFAAAVSLTSLACGGTPAAPHPPVTATAITLTASTDMLKVAERFTFSATASHSDGSNAAVNDWSSDAPTVAIVEATSGIVTGIGAGQATIIGRHDGVTGTNTTLLLSIA